MMRIVVTGVGIVSPLGVGAEASWAALLAGRSGLRRLDAALAPDVAGQVAGIVPGATEQGGFDPDHFVPAKDQKKMDRFIQFGIAAADEALLQAGWAPQAPADQEATATVIATGIGGFHAIVDAVQLTETRGVRRLSPFTIPAFLGNLAAGWVSIRRGFKGPIGAPVSACAAGVQAIGDAARMIRNGEANIAVCGGTEAAINRVSLGAFGAARALSSNFNDHPTEASRPFDSRRDGFVMGEGAGILVIESLDHALARGAKPMAEIVGYGTSADAYHLTAGPEDGDGATRSMRTALRQAGVRPDQIDHLNAHATSTQVGDKGELAAIRTLFGSEHSPAISATKSATGHLLGAAGGLEAVFSVLALRDQIAPPTLNFTDPDPLTEGLDIVGQHSRPMRIDYVLSNGFGFGGVNASLLLRRWSPDAAVEGPSA